MGGATTEGRRADGAPMGRSDTNRCGADAKAPMGVRHAPPFRVGGALDRRCAERRTHRAERASARCARQRAPSPRTSPRQCPATRRRRHGRREWRCVSTSAGAATRGHVSTLIVAPLPNGCFLSRDMGCDWPRRREILSLGSACTACAGAMVAACRVGLALDRSTDPYLAARDDRARVAHAAAGRRGGACHRAREVRRRATRRHGQSTACLVKRGKRRVRGRRERSRGAAHDDAASQRRIGAARARPSRSAPLLRRHPVGWTQVL